MKKVFILAYARQNLGDDIFIKMLLERFPNIDFFIKVPNYEYVRWLDENYKNLSVSVGKDTDIQLNKMNVEEYDGYVYIGGSIFMEGGKVYNLSESFFEFVNKCKEKNIPFCYISSNYGPYQTQTYFELSKKNFETCTDICFRDLYSYNLFKNISSVRYAPDYIFNLDLKKKSKNKDSIGISVINRGEEFNKKYYSFLCNNIEKLLQEGKDIYLFSFCKHEGDEITIDYILNKFKNSSKIHDIRYDGDINKFLKIYTNMEYMITLRFHAMILSLIAGQKIMVMSYSKKIDNVIDDLKLDLNLIKMNEINENVEINLNDFKEIDENKIKKISIEAAEQEKAIKDFII